jgi:hypothetical protein
MTDTLPHPRAAALRDLSDETLRRLLGLLNRQPLTRRTLEDRALVVREIERRQATP